MTFDSGLVELRSCDPHAVTIERLVSSLAMRSIPLLARIDHAHAARLAGRDMPPTEVFVFGNAAVGTPLMIEVPSIAIDLPLRILVAEEVNGICWLTYVDPLCIGRRHGLGASHSGSLRAMRDLLASLATEAAGRNEPTDRAAVGRSNVGTVRTD